MAATERRPGLLRSANLAAGRGPLLFITTQGRSVLSPAITLPNGGRMATRRIHEDLDEGARLRVVSQM